MVIVVADRFEPCGRTTRRIRLLNREVNHRRMRRRTMPVALAGLEPNGVAWINLHRRFAGSPHATDAGKNVQRLSMWMRVPRRPRARLE